MPRTPVRRVGQESASLQVLVPGCSSCNGLMGRMVRCTKEANYFRDYKRLGPIAKLATSYKSELCTLSTRAYAIMRSADRIRRCLLTRRAHRGTDFPLPCQRG